MGLINLTTNLKSIKYGNDRIHGGNSGQPYIQSPIPDGISSVGVANNDFMLRGGIDAVTDSAVDVLRLGKMFVDLKTPNGLFFTAKQNLLSRTAVRTQTSGILNEGIYTPLSTLAEAGVIAFGGHLNKQGINPFAGTGAYSTNLNLYGPHIVIQKTLFPSDANRLVNLYNNKISTSDSSVNVLSYSGGPGSVLGIGKTNIRFADQRTGVNNAWGNEIVGGTYQTSRMLGTPESWVPYNGVIDAYNTFNLNNVQVEIIDSPVQKGIYSYELNTTTNVYKSGSLETDTAITFTNDSLTYTQDQLNGAEGGDLNKDIRNSLSSPGAPKTQDFRALLRAGLTKSTILSKAPSYDVTKNKTVEGRINYGNPGNAANKNLISYTKGSGIGPVDKINALALYQSENVTSKNIKNDLVKFRIASIDNSNPSKKIFMHFRALLSNISDSYNAPWNSSTYLGRGENFYTYSNYTRTISLSWTVAAQSREELIPMYKKLNYLASNMAPDYTSNGYMAGNLVQLTIGGYLYEQVGIITGLTYDMQEDTTWEVGINDDGNYDPDVKELPHIIRVSNFTFIPIQSFLPAKQHLPTINSDAEVIKKNSSDTNEYGLQRFIALANGDENNAKLNNYDS